MKPRTGRASNSRFYNSFSRVAGLGVIGTVRGATFPLYAPGRK